MNSGSNRLPALAEEVAELHRQAEHHNQAAAEKALAAGAALVEAKALIAHGGWADWLAKAGIPERTAQRYMRLHKAGFESATVAFLGIAQAEVIAAAGSRLLPKPAAGKLITGSDGRQEVCIITWRPDDGESAFCGGAIFPHNEQENASQAFMKKPMTLLGLGMFHANECGSTKLDKPIELTAEEAEEELLKLCGARIERHAWGNRLAATWGAAA